MELIDFTKYEKGTVNYGGSERKESILVPNGTGAPSDYMLKFRKRTEFGMRDNHVSEYLGSHIFELLGYEAQKTFLGVFEGEQVVACKSFVNENVQFVPFNDVGESTLDEDKETYQYEYGDIMQMLRDNSKLTDVSWTVSMFWEMFVVDALIGNFDRHGLNWGFLKENNRYSLAPVFDNGSCLFPNLVGDDECREVIGSDEETEYRVYKYPTSQIKLHGRKSSYFEVIDSLEFAECNEALAIVMDRIEMSKIYDLVEATDVVSEVHREFYKHMLEARYRLILEEPYRRYRRSAHGK